jgi:hypothetical protein
VAGHDPLVTLRLIYQMVSTLLGWIVLRTRSDTTKEIEILVLRHQLAVLQGRMPRPRVIWADRALIGAVWWSRHGSRTSSVGRRRLRTRGSRGM